MKKLVRKYNEAMRYKYLCELLLATLLGAMSIALYVSDLIFFRHDLLAYFGLAILATACWMGTLWIISIWEERERQDLRCH